MLKVGLTGGLACGKTFVGEALAELGCLLIQADELGHEVLEPGGEAYGPVLAEFGKGILAGNGHIDRQALAERVFNSPERLARRPGRGRGPAGRSSRPGPGPGCPPTRRTG